MKDQDSLPIGVMFGDSGRLEDGVWRNRKADMDSEGLIGKTRVSESQAS